MTKKYSSGDHKVGYCNPPKHSRFQKGQSGNPKGRPRGSRSLSAIAGRELERIVQTNSGQRGEKMKTAEAIIRAHMIKAIKGDVRSAEFIMKLLAYNDNDAAEAIDGVPALPDDDQKILDDYVARQKRLGSGQRGEDD